MLVHLDTDIGGDIDDLCALALILSQPSASLCGVTTVLDGDGRRAGYARYVLDLVGREDVPVAAGAADDRFGLPDESRYWPEPIAPLPGRVDRAVDLLEESLDRGATLIGIGPFTNLALLEQRRPGVLRSARVFVMGGTLERARDDFNVQADPESALCVFEACSPTLVPIEITLQTALRTADVPLLQAGGPLARLLARQAEAFAADHPEMPPGVVNYQHDPLTVAVALGWDGVTLAPDPRGRMVTAVDAARFNAYWLEQVCRT